MAIFLKVGLVAARSLRPARFAHVELVLSSCENTSAASQHRQGVKCRFHFTSQNLHLQVLVLKEVFYNLIRGGGLAALQQLR
jgi:hypothetical protein